MTAAHDGPDDSAPHAFVSVVVVTYEPDLELLRDCIGSVVASTHRPLELIVVDNASRQHDVTAFITESWPVASHHMTIRILPQRTNLGYAAATNLGVRASGGDLILLLNPDANIARNALDELVRSAAKHRDIGGFAPKILLSDPPFVLDSVGMAMGTGCEGVQRGLGQIDVGQFDQEEPVNGLCFAAACIRRSLWEATSVGELDQSYFMYYEDVDWSLRARILGQRFMTVPSARVHHFHSATTRHLGSGYKIRLIQRNLIWTASKNLDSHAFLKVLLRRSVGNVRRAVRGQYPVHAIRAVAEAWLGLPQMLKRRRALQRRRVLPDASILGLGGEQTFFDADHYRPQASLPALSAAMTRLYAVQPSPELQALVVRLQSAETSGISGDGGWLAKTVRESGTVVTEGMEWIISEMSRRGIPPS